ncbi:ABC transporter permease [Caulobacter soli]|uniref:ABC transporter permease n=1 Tax=Caulobacter soli TaxID=2708539 RepID=UPI0013EE3885|nr:ABC transporter permease [Caulobacter soli]
MRPVSSTRAKGGFSTLIQGFDVQRHVIGALIMRELHTRYGRENIGYLWMIVEPMLLAAAVGALHAKAGGGHAGIFHPVPFALGGYCVFMIFRSVIGRSETTLEANKPLLYHRTVTLFDMLLARALLEGAATLAALVILLAGTWALGMGAPIARPLTFIGAVLLMTWFAFALSMPVCAASYLSKAVGKFVHPIIYIAMPISGGFFLLAWIPQPFRGWLSWSPLNQIFEMLHTSQFEAIESRYFDPLYIVEWCLALTLVGLLSLRVVRPHVHLT